MELETHRMAEHRHIKKIFDQQAQLEANDIEILTFKEQQSEMPSDYEAGNIVNHKIINNVHLNLDDENANKRHGKKPKNYKNYES